jgi:poly(A) polymerase
MNPHPPVTLALGVLLHDVGKPPTFRIAERIRFDGHDSLGAKMAVDVLSRLRFSSQQIRRVELLVKDHLRFKDVPRMRPATLKRFLRQPHFEELLELHRLDCLASHRRLETYYFLLEMLRQTPAERLSPPPLLRGADLIAAGYEPGPLFGRILAAVEEAQLEGRLETRDQALAFVLAEFGPPAGARSGGPVGEDQHQDQHDDRQNG